MAVEQVGREKDALRVGVRAVARQPVVGTQVVEGSCLLDVLKGHAPLERRIVGEERCVRLAVGSGVRLPVARSQVVLDRLGIAQFLFGEGLQVEPVRADLHFVHGAP